MLDVDTIASEGRTGQAFGDIVGRQAEASATPLAPVPSQPVVSDLDAAIRFLKAFDLDGRHNLVAIHPETRMVTGRTFEPLQWSDISDWISEFAGRRNIYFSVNEPAAGAPNGKLKKTEIAKVRALFVDVDPPGKASLDLERQDIAKQAATAQSMTLPPSFTIDSGGGTQFFWSLVQKLEAAEAQGWAEGTGQALAGLFGGDRVQNIDRIMRLPGTLNLPDAKKRAKGRVERVAKLTHETGRLFHRDQFESSIAPAARRERGNAPAQADLVCDTDLVRRALEAMPNTAEHFPRRSDWLEVCVAVRAATANDQTAGRELWENWSSQWPSYAAGDTADMWESFAETSSFQIGADWLIAKAAAIGGIDGAKVHQTHVCAKWFDAYLAATAQSPEAGHDGKDATGMFGAEPRAPLVVDIFGHGDPGDLGTPPAGSLPPVLLAWARTEARRKGVSEAFAAASAVAVAGSAIGASLKLQVKQLDTGWKEPASLWMTLIAPPGSAKSAIIGAAAEPLKKLDAEYRREWAPQHAAWERADKAARKSRKDQPVADAGFEPVCPRVVLDSFTAEKIIRVFAENPRGVMCTPDELSGLLGSFGAYKASGDGDRGMFLRFFDGGDVKSDRVGGGTISAESALLGILASSQPDKIRKMADNLGGDGLLQRCLFVMHDGRDKTGLDEAPDEEACAIYAHVIRGLAKAEYRFPDPIRLSAEAAIVRSEGWLKLRSLRWIFGASAAFTGHVEKYEKFLSRLILIFHCVEEFGRPGVVDPEVRVSAATVSMAVEFAGFLMRHSLEFYREFVGASDIVEDVQWVAGFLLAHPERTSVSKRDLYNVQRRFAGTSGHKLCIATMSELETAGWVQAKDRKSAADKDVWNVNPAIHVLFAEHAKREKRRRLESQERIKQAGAARRWASGVESGEDTVVTPVAASAFN